ncbi:MAG: hypothetical protein KF807_00250 [Xanthobacteraceae bacterium]|nr:hypothetical protein [Xanthobacteraceae bacterium]
MRKVVTGDLDLEGKLIDKVVKEMEASFKAAADMYLAELVYEEGKGFSNAAEDKQHLTAEEYLCEFFRDEVRDGITIALRSKRKNEPGK